MAIFPKVNFDKQGYTAARAANLDNLNATITSRLGAITSIQRGYISTLENSEGTRGLTNTANITSIAMARSFLTTSPRSGGFVAFSGNYAYSQVSAAYISSPTQITIMQQLTAGTDNIQNSGLRYEVVTYGA